MDLTISVIIGIIIAGIICIGIGILIRKIDLALAITLGLLGFTFIIGIILISRVP